MRTHLTIGPGTHGSFLKEYLIRQCENVSIAEYWPKFTLHHYEKSQLKGTTYSRSFDFATWLLYGINNRFSSLTDGRQFQQHLLMSMYDRICVGHLTLPCSMIGFSMTSLQSFNRNREAGGLNVLEHGMIHVDTWTKMVDDFYRSDAYKIKPGFSKFSEAMVTRIRQEYDVAHYIQVHSSFALNTFIAAGVSRDRLLLTTLGTDFHDRATQRVLNHTSKLRVLYFGRIELLKGVDLLLDFMDSEEAGKISLRLAGRIMPDMVERMRRQAKHQYVGILDSEQLRRELASTDLVVFPTRYDAFGMVILEAMAAGVPVLCSRSSAGPDIIEDGVDGFLFDAGDIAALSNGIKRSLEERDRLMTMGMAARQKVESKFSLGAYYQRLDAALRKIDFLP